ncbi:hypothetical protein BT96DRAFT_946791 [Gymnopus androsaceus JB14]|uniref:Uncharacterized protein n=1 Tax=Gymnopus androsaceus JB14 TaxID=1447944 RepID=A0A6A4GVR6_9AGAR|nr:hypothetical protein BT96DRAFT_946791 [Gymnopus androsaceus JB14]
MIHSRQGLGFNNRAGFNNQACKSQLSSKLSAKHEKVEIADEQAEQDFLNLCRSFSESDDKDTVIIKQPLAPSRAIQPTGPRVFTTISETIVQNYSKEPLKDGFLPNAPVASPVPVLFAGKDDAWWRAEYARRDAAFLGEEQARQASKRYYERLAIFVVLC